MKKLSNLLLTFLSFTMILGCVTSQHGVNPYDIYHTQYDVAKDQFRQKLKILHTPGWNEEESYQSCQQEIFKFSNVDSTYDYWFYDNIYIPHQINYQLEPLIYLIIDEHIYEIPFEMLDANMRPVVHTEEEEVLLADSTDLDVIVNYQLIPQRVISTKYQVPKAALNDILLAKTVIFRYYYGPGIIDLRYDIQDLCRIKELMKRNPQVYLNRGKL